MDIKGIEAVLTPQEMVTLGIRNGNTYPISYLRDKLPQEIALYKKNLGPIYDRIDSDAFELTNAERGFTYTSKEILERRLEVLHAMTEQIIIHEMEVEFS